MHSHECFEVVARVRDVVRRGVAAIHPHHYLLDGLHRWKAAHRKKIIFILRAVQSTVISPECFPSFSRARAPCEVQSDVVPLLDARPFEKI